MLEEEFYDSFLPAVDIAGITLDNKVYTLGADIQLPGIHMKHTSEEKLHIDFDMFVEWTTSNLEMSRWLQQEKGILPESFFGCKLLQVEHFAPKLLRQRDKNLEASSVLCISHIQQYIKEKEFWDALMASNESLNQYFKSKNIDIRFQMKNIVADAWNNAEQHSEYVDWDYQTVKLVPANDVDFYTDVDTKHLQYFVFSYVDFRKIAQELGLEQQYVNFDMVETRVDSYVLLEDGNIVMDEVNVQDFRMAEYQQAVLLEPVSIEESLAIANFETMFGKPIDSLDRILGNEQEYTSEIFLTKDFLGYSKFLFGVNLRKILEKNSVFAPLLNNTKSLFKNVGKVKKADAIISELLAGAKIHSLKLLRRRVKEDAVGSYILFDDSEYEEVLLQKKEQTLTTTLIPQIQQNVDKMKSVGDKLMSHDHFGITNDTEAAILKEIAINLPDMENEDVNYRFFTGTDKEIATKTFGTYQYGIELDIEDKGIQIVRNYVSRLDNAVAFFNEYYNRATIQGNYDIASNSFTNAFRSTLINRSKAGAEQIKKNVADFASIVAYFDGSVDVAELTKNLYNMVSPGAGSPKGIQLVLSFINSFITKLTNYYGIQQENDNNDQTGRSSSSKGDHRYIKVKKWFNQVFDADAGKNVGYSYLLSDAKRNDPERYDGLLVLSNREYSVRVQSEVDKYYSDRASGVSINVGKTDSKMTLSSTDILKSSISYLTPRFVMLNRDFMYDLVSVSSFDELIEIEASILFYNVERLLGSQKDNRDFSSDLKLLMNGEGATFSSPNAIKRRPLVDLPVDLYRGVKEITVSDKSITASLLDDDEVNVNILLYDLMQFFLIDGNTGTADVLDDKKMSSVIKTLNPKRISNYFNKRMTRKLWI